MFDRRVFGLGALFVAGCSSSSASPSHLDAGLDAAQPIADAGTRANLDAANAANVDAGGDDAHSTSGDAAVDAGAGCGNGVCDPNETANTCPHDCVLQCSSVTVDETQQRMWDTQPIDTSVPFDQALDGCQALNFDGYGGWQLPASGDYEAMFGPACHMSGAFIQCPSCADSEACNAMFPGDTRIYWAATSFQLGYASGIQFANGLLTPGYSESDGDGGAFLAVRCTRALTACPTGTECAASETCVGGGCVPTGCTAP